MIYMIYSTIMNIINMNNNGTDQVDLTAVANHFKHQPVLCLLVLFPHTLEPQQSCTQQLHHKQLFWRRLKII